MDDASTTAEKVFILVVVARALLGAMKQLGYECISAD